MKILSKCTGCNKKKLFIYHRLYKVKHVVGYITTQGELCGKCARIIIKLVK